MHEDLMHQRRLAQEYRPSSFKEERRKSVSFFPTERQRNTLEQTSCSQQQASRRVELSPAAPKRSTRVQEQSKQQQDQLSRKEGSSDTEGVRISKDFKNQLCQAFNIQNLDQLQKLLPYQPTASQPLFSRKRQQTYYENDLTYIAAASEDSASESSDKGRVVRQRVSIQPKASKDRSGSSSDMRALLSQREKPLRGKWVPPTHIPQLDESIEDYDLWFQQMHQYLL